MRKYGSMHFNVQPLHKVSGDWYRIENSADLTQVHVYDDIGNGGVSAKSFLADLAGIKGPIELHLSSGGGEVFDGIAIYNSLKQRGNVAIVIDSLAASIASVIAMSADTGKLSIARNATMMIHDGFGMTVGNAADMRQMADLLDKTSDNIATIYAERTGRPANEWREAMKTETWYSADEAVNAGLADRVLPSMQSAVQNPPADKPKKKKFLDSKATQFFNEKYNTDDRKRMASEGTAMPDGSYPIADEEDLHNAIRAVGRGGADHDAIRRHVIKRAKALGKSDAIPDNWNADGSLQDGWNPSVISSYFTTRGVSK